MHNPESTEILGYLRLREVLELIPISRSVWWEGISRGIYPSPIKLSPGTTAWRVADIKALIDRINTHGSPCVHAPQTSSGEVK